MVKQQRTCPSCGLPLTYFNRGHNRRPDKTDKRCYNCVEIQRESALLSEQLRQRKIERRAARIIAIERRKLERKRERREAEEQAH